MLGTISPAAMVSTPLDATPDPEGTTIYFTAISPIDGPGVFSVPAAGGSVTKVFAGDPFVSPFGIAITGDGKTLYIADSGAENATDTGSLWVVPVGGAMPTALSGPDGYRPKSLEISGSNLYFTGVDPMNGNAGAFKVPTAGGMVSAVASGLVDPSGIAIAANGTAYVVDTIGSGGQAQVISATDGTSSVLVDGLGVGYPAGIALVQDESAILVSGVDPAKGTDVVYRVEISSKALTTNTKGIDTFNEAAGLHRAKNQDIYAWADSRANGGTVFVLSK
jgi:DNA-binding beta-propeller fold protein YncE